MTRGATEVTALALREAFDRSFAEPIAAGRGSSTDVLLLRAGTSAVAVMLGEVAALAKCPPITPLPSRSPGLLGIAGLRGRLVGVYALERHDDRPDGGFVLVCRADRSVGLRFDELLGYLRIDSEQIHGSDHGEAPETEVVRAGEHSYPLVRLGRVLSTIRAASPAGAGKER